MPGADISYSFVLESVIYDNKYLEQVENALTCNNAQIGNESLMHKGPKDEDNFINEDNLKK